jgi:hypothetical protein
MPEPIADILTREIHDAIQAVAAAHAPVSRTLIIGALEVVKLNEFRRLIADNEAREDEDPDTE